MDLYTGLRYDIAQDRINRSTPHHAARQRPSRDFLAPSLGERVARLFSTKPGARFAPSPQPAPSSQ